MPEQRLTIVVSSINGRVDLPNRRIPAIIDDRSVTITLYAERAQWGQFCVTFFSGSPEQVTLANVVRQSVLATTSGTIYRFGFLKSPEGDREALASTLYKLFRLDASNWLHVPRRKDEMSEPKKEDGDGQQVEGGQVNVTLPPQTDRVVASPVVGAAPPPVPREASDTGEIGFAAPNDVLPVPSPAEGEAVQPRPLGPEDETAVTPIEAKASQSSSSANSTAPIVAPEPAGNGEPVLDESAASVPSGVLLRADKWAPDPVTGRVVVEVGGLTGPLSRDERFALQLTTGEILILGNDQINEGANLALHYAEISALVNVGKTYKHDETGETGFVVEFKADEMEGQYALLWAAFETNASWERPVEVTPLPEPPPAPAPVVVASMEPATAPEPPQVPLPEPAPRARTPSTARSSDSASLPVFPDVPVSSPPIRVVRATGLSRPRRIDTDPLDPPQYTAAPLEDDVQPEQPAVPPPSAEPPTVDPDDWYPDAEGAFRVLIGSVGEEPDRPMRARFKNKQLVILSGEPNKVGAEFSLRYYRYTGSLAVTHNVGFDRDEGLQGFAVNFDFLPFRIKTDFNWAFDHFRVQRNGFSKPPDPAEVAAEMRAPPKRDEPESITIPARAPAPSANPPTIRVPARSAEPAKGTVVHKATVRHQSTDEASKAAPRKSEQSRDRDKRAEAEFYGTVSGVGKGRRWGFWFLVIPMAILGGLIGFVVSQVGRMPPVVEVVAKPRPPPPVVEVSPPPAPEPAPVVAPPLVAVEEVLQAKEPAPPVKQATEDEFGLPLSPKKFQECVDSDARVDAKIKCCRRLRAAGVRGFCLKKVLKFTEDARDDGQEEEE